VSKDIILDKLNAKEIITLTIIDVSGKEKVTKAHLSKGWQLRNSTSKYSVLRTKKIFWVLNCAMK
jgi:hypothetical protein